MVNWSQALSSGMDSAAIPEGEEDSSIFEPDYYIEDANDLWHILREDK